MRIDHVTIAAPRLEPLVEAFRTAGLEPQYGGPHSNGVTHMSWLGFEDYSYLELVSTVQPGAGVPLWKGHIPNPEGGAAWTIYSEELATDMALASDAEVAVHGPIHVERHKPDGRTGRWDLAYLGDSAPGSVLPFLIHDETPRSVRVTPSPCLAGMPGLQTIVLAVEALQPHVEAFRRIWGWDWPAISSCREMNAGVARFAGTPVVLAAPEGKGWIADHLEQYGESPAATLFCCTPAQASRFHTTAGAIGSEAVAWLSLPGVTAIRVGLICC
jgi:hypothetical protein